MGHTLKQKLLWLYSGGQVTAPHFWDANYYFWLWKDAASGFVVVVLFEAKARTDQEKETFLQMDHMV